MADSDTPLSSAPSPATAPSQSTGIPGSVGRPQQQHDAIRTSALFLCWSIYAAGIVWRYFHCFLWHPATDFIKVSMRDYVGRANRMWNANHVESMSDIVFPPGGHFHIGLISRAGQWLDGTMGGWLELDSPLSAVMAVQFVESCLIPLLIAAIGYELYGHRVALVGLVLASIYYPFVDYAAYFMTEGPYTFFLVLTMWLLVRSLRVQSSRLGFMFAVLAGLSLGVTSSFKTVALACGAVMFAWLAFTAVRSQWHRIWLFLGGSALGLLVVVVPLINRATRINDGKLTPISTNGALTVLLGHSGEYGKFYFNDPKRKRGGSYWFTPPGGHQRGYRAQRRFSFGPYDSRAMLREAWSWTRSNPGTALRMSLQHVQDLFQGIANPSSGEAKWQPWMYWFQRFYWVFILVPMVAHLLFHFKRLFQTQGPGLADALLLTPLLALMIVSFLTIGQARYRIPFDTFQILLAAQCYVGGIVRVDGLVPWDQRLSHADESNYSAHSWFLAAQFPAAAIMCAAAYLLMVSVGWSAALLLACAIVWLFLACWATQRTFPGERTTTPPHAWPRRVALIGMIGVGSIVLIQASLPGTTSRRPSSRKPSRRKPPPPPLKVEASLLHSLEDHDSYVVSVCFSPDGQQIASGSYDNTARLWDTKTGQLLRTFEGHEGYVRSVAFEPKTGNVLATGSHDGTIRLWNVKDGGCIKTLSGHEGPVLHVAFSRDGSKLASGGKDKSVRIWDVESGTQVRKLQDHNSWVKCLTFDRNDTTLVTVSRSTRLFFWDVETGKLKTEVKAHSDHLSSVALSQDGMWLASTGTDKRIKLWDMNRIRNQKPLKTIKAHSERIETVAFSNNRRILASGSRDMTVIIWDLSTKMALKVLSEHSGAVNCVAFSPDGSMLASASHDGTVKIWKLNWK